MKEDADDFLKRVEDEGKLIKTFIKDDKAPEKDDKILIYEYKMNEKDYEVVIHKCNQNYVNYYIKII